MLTLRKRRNHDGPDRPGQQGSTLLMVILLSLVAAAIGSTLLLMSNTDHMIAANERDAERALQASRAGLAYAYHLFDQGLITPTAGGAAFDSFATGIGAPLEGGEFTGRFFDLSSLMSQGQLYRIESTGGFGRASRTTEMVFQIVPEAFKYGYIAFNRAQLDNHSGHAGPDFRIESTIFSNNEVAIAEELTLDGSIIAGGPVDAGNNSTITRDVFANDIKTNGVIQGKARLLTTVRELPADELVFDRTDADGTKYEWYDGNSSPGSFSGTPPPGGVSSYAIQDGDAFKHSIFRRNGSLIASPDVNVVKFVNAPKLDYQAMKAVAEENDPTYFTSTDAAVAYMITKKVNETIGGVSVTTVRIGTPDAPEFLYIDGDLELTVQPGVSDDPSKAEIQADAFYIEGGIYITGNFDFDGPDYPDATPQYPPAPDYYALSINALDYCFPALVAYEQPTTGSIATWTPDDTPAIGTGVSIKMSGGDEGPTFFNGVVYAQDEIHLHHTSDPRELIHFNGAELAWKVHNCDYFWFSYDPAVRCTRFLVSEDGTPQVVSYREVR